MALIDLIAQSGEKNFEKIRKGWLPTATEKAAEQMAQLTVKAKQQAVDYEPERQQLKRESSLANLEYKKALTEQHKLDTEKFKSDQDKTKRNLEIQSRGRILREAQKLDSIPDQKDFLFSQVNALFPKGSDPKKKDAYMSMLNLRDDQFKDQFKLARQGNKYLQGLNEKLFGKKETYYNAETKQIAQVSKDSPTYYEDSRKLTDKDFIESKKIGIELEGASGKLKNKKAISLNDRVDERVEIKAQITNAIAGYGRLIDFVASDNYKSGVVGDVVNIANDLVRQSKLIFGSDSALDANGEIDFNKIEKGSGVAGELRKIANKGRRYQAALIEMAFMKAKAMNRGKISDADYRFAKKILDNGMDKSITLNILRDGLYGLEGDFNRTSDIYNESYDTDAFGKISADKILGWNDFSPQNQQSQAATDYQQRKQALAARVAAAQKARLQMSQGQP